MKAYQTCLVVLFLSSLLIFLGSSQKQALAEKEKTMDIDSKEEFMIYDFSDLNRTSVLGTGWEMTTDQVMGGRSEGSLSFEEIQGQPCLRLRGNVSLENRGGFIQASLSIKQNRKFFDASSYKGLRLLVRGNGETYYIHFKNSQTLMPWQHYEASFFAGEQWSEVEVPFSEFSPQYLKKAFSPQKLKSLAVVAAKKEFTADIAVARVAFY
jgi:hypothetical protein